MKNSALNLSRRLATANRPKTLAALKDFRALSDHERTELIESWSRDLKRSDSLKSALAAVRALGLVAPYEPSALSAWIDVLGHTSGDLVIEADALMAFWDADTRRRVIEVLGTELQCGERPGVLTALRAVRVLRPAPAGLMPSIVGVTRSKDERLAFEAVQALCHFGAPARPFLQEISADPRIKIRIALAEGLPAFPKDDPIALELLGRLLADAETRVRHAALCKLQLVSSDGLRAVPALRQALAHGDADEIREAVFCVQESGQSGKDVRDLLGQALNYEDESVRQRAVFALERLGATHPDGK